MSEAETQNSDLQNQNIAVMPKKRKPVRRCLLYFLALLLVLIIIPFVLPMGSGSKSYARDWSERFSTLNSPEVAQQKYPEIAVMKLDGGQWIYGVCKDSHSSPWGGTIVVRDSRGRVRCFFGHVCGDKFLKATFNRFTTTHHQLLEDNQHNLRETHGSLDDFYRELQGRPELNEWIP